MALDTYDSLNASVALWLNKTKLTNQIPDFIALSVTRANRLLRTLKMQCRARADFTDEHFQLPANFAGLTDIRIRKQDDDADLWTALPYKGHVEINDLDSGVIGRPKYYTIIGHSTGDRIHLIPVPDQTYTAEMVGYERVALDADHQTSWLLSDHPDILLYGALLAAAAYLDHDERITTWANLHQVAVKELRESDRFDRSGDRREPPEYF